MKIENYKLKKIIMPNKKAFTLIELLIIVAIIGLLASVVLVTLNTARNRARDNSFKTTAKSVQTALVSCCINSGTALGNTADGLICASGGKYPNETSIGPTIIENDCVGSVFNVTITPGTKNSGNCESATITTENIVYTGTGC